MSGSMSTAPKDGTTILIKGKKKEHEFWWDKNKQWWRGEYRFEHGWKGVYMRDSDAQKLTWRPK